MVKEKNKIFLVVMCIFWVFEKFVWSMFCDGDIFVEVEINSMVCFFFF